MAKVPLTLAIGEYAHVRDLADGPVSVAGVDLTVLRCDAHGASCEPLDMGTDFDFFGTRANTDSPEVSAEQRANRQLLLKAMDAQGFSNYAMEWWHYSFRFQPPLEMLYDVPITEAR